MKKIKILVAALLIGSFTYAQQPPQGGGGNGINWRRGGNFGVPTSPNIFGTAAGNNNPIYTYTNGIQRMKINGTTPSTSGFVGIGTNFNNPQSPLHVEGSGSFSSIGWKRGITLSNFDALAFSNARSNIARFYRVIILVTYKYVLLSRIYT